MIHSCKSCESSENILIHFKTNEIKLQSVRKNSIFNLYRISKQALILA